MEERSLERGKHIKERRYERGETQREKEGGGKYSREREIKREGDGDEWKQIRRERKRR